MAYANRLSGDKYAYIRYLDHIAKYTVPEEFILFVRNEKNLINNPGLLYLLALRNSNVNNSLYSLVHAREYCLKIPKNVLALAKSFKNQIFYEYLNSISWLNSLGGY